MTRPRATKTVLIIEDEKSLLRALAQQCTREGFQVITATSGTLGLKLAQEASPDIILLDILMPVMDGNEVLRQMRASSVKSLRDVPVIVLTNLGEADHSDQYTALGATACFIKADWSIQDIVARVHTFLNTPPQAFKARVAQKSRAKKSLTTQKQSTRRTTTARRA